MARNLGLSVVWPVVGSAVDGAVLSAEERNVEDDVGDKGCLGVAFVGERGG